MQDKKADIFNAGRELFNSKGFKDTNVPEITKLAGIGVGTFYSYYTSKEELFLEVFMKENEKLKKRLMEAIDTNDDPITLAAKLAKHNIDEMNSNLILQEWYNGDLFSKLEKYFYKHGGMESIDGSIHGVIVQLVKKWKAEGKIRDDLDDDMIIAIFNAIPYIDVHKSEIGVQHFPQLMHYITDFIMKGLTACPK